MKCRYVWLFFSMVYAVLQVGDAQGQDLDYLKYKKKVPRVSAESALLKYQTGRVIIVDAMQPETYRKYHILGAVNLCGDGPKWYRRILNAKLPFPKSQPILVYCD